jgi:hypothetical protein
MSRNPGDREARRSGNAEDPGTQKTPVQWTGVLIQERTTRLELATSTLARLRSTN